MRQLGYKRVTATNDEDCESVIEMLQKDPLPLYCSSSPRTLDLHVLVLVPYMSSVPPGTDIWHCFLDILLVYAVLRVFGGTALSVGLVWIITLVSECHDDVLFV